MKKVIFYGAVLIGVYIAVSNATGGGKLLQGGSAAAGTIITKLQGR